MVSAYNSAISEAAAREGAVVVDLHALGVMAEREGTEGELYNHEQDPYQWRNLWDDTASQKFKRDLIDDLYRNMPQARSEKLLVEAPT